jgi:hypothetical protein
MRDDAESLRRERAEVLYDDIPYVRGWAQAQRAALSLADELRALGLEEDFAYMKSDVNVHGEGVVRLDLIPADAAKRLAELLSLGLCAELERLPVAEDVSDRASPAA